MSSVMKYMSVPTDIITVDNAIRDPMSMRVRAIDSPFGDTELLGGTYQRSCRCEIPELVEAVEKTLGRPMTTVGCGFVLRYENEAPNYLVHADDDLSDFAAVLYLNPPAQCIGGTIFWKHKKKDLDRVTDNDNLKVDWNDKGAWLQVDSVEMKFNRLVVYPGNRFHSWAPHGYGNSPETGRLVAVGFFKERGEEPEEVQPIIIRGANIDDLEFILTSAQHFHTESGSHKLAPLDYRSVAISAKDLIDKGIVLIAEVNGVPAGSIAAYTYPLLFNHSARVFHEQWLWVNPRYRKSGVGGSLINALEKEVQGRGGLISFLMALPGSNFGKMAEKLGYSRGETMYFKRHS